MDLLVVLSVLIWVTLLLRRFNAFLELVRGNLAETSRSSEEPSEAIEEITKQSDSVEA